ncbi:MAG: aldehyde dehydrogenase family protein [Planctomycetota bacterium]|nr:aldehyde dehydrogenase family protein [Planctomycetota bacterium]MDA1113419.1 aldehyde dehydrogenase family protein [Planctomycetota bacterium]
MSSVDAVVSRIAQQANTWRALDSPRRADILQSCMAGVRGVAEEWVELTCRAKGISMDSPLAGEEWYTGPGILLRHLRLYRDTLLRGGFPAARIEKSCVSWSAKVFPFDRWDGILFPGLSAEVRGLPNSEPTCLTLGPGGCAAVLGAGNVQSIAPLDMLYQLLKENRVVVVKMNPVNAYLQPVLEQAFAPMMAAGFLGFVEGEAKVGEELISHPKINAVHLTGSEDSFRKVLAVPGVKEKQATAELGAVSPVIVVPGRWSHADIQFQAKQIAGMMLVNNAFNCNAPKLLVTSRSWPQREEFLQALRDAFQSAPKRKAWYPGAEERWNRFVHEYEGKVPPRGQGETPPVLLVNVPADETQLALKEEAFCAVLAETNLAADSEESFLRASVDFVNESVYGTLSCTVIAAPSTNKAHLESAIDRLRYGCVGVNVWAGLGFALGTTTWGAFPGHTRENPGSGLGVVHNTFLFDAASHTILRGRFRPWMKPFWMPNHRTLGKLGLGLVNYEMEPSLGKVARLIPSALLG